MKAANKNNCGINEVFQRMIGLPQQKYVGLSTLQQVTELLAQQFYKAEKTIERR